MFLDQFKLNKIPFKILHYLLARKYKHSVNFCIRVDPKVPRDLY